MFLWVLMSEMQAHWISGAGSGFSMWVRRSRRHRQDGEDLKSVSHHCLITCSLAAELARIAKCE